MIEALSTPAPRVSVVVAFRDAEDTLARCLDAVCSQRLGGGREGEDFEVLAVDNDSADRSTEIARAAARQHRHLRVLAESRPGAYHARNYGVAQARGDVLVFTDADCVPVEGWLERLVAAVDEPGARVVMGRDRPAGAGRCIRLLGAYDHSKEALVLGGTDPNFYYGHTNNLATTRETLEEVGGFDPRPRGADVIFVQQVLQRHGTDSVRYRSGAMVEHLEIDSAWVYYRKAVIYGRSARRYCKVVPARPLSARLRWRSYRRTVEEHGLRGADSALLLLLLVIGALAYQWGWFAERWAIAWNRDGRRTDSGRREIPLVSGRSMTQSTPTFVRQGGDLTTAPALSVVTVTASTFAVVRRTVRFLREQTIADRIELILVGPDASAWDDMGHEEVLGFHSWRCIAAGPIEEIELGYTAGIGSVRAPVMALLENHVFCDPDWAAAILRSHEGPWSAVGSLIRNANGASVASWVEHFLTYGFHDAGTPGGETTHIARNNCTFKTAIFQEEDLGGPGIRAADLLTRDGGLLGALRARGHRFWRDTEACMDHLNPSRASAVLRMRIPSARASAATRARTLGWSRARRWLYVAASPVFPALRLRALWPIVHGHPDRPSLLRLAPLFTLALLADALGQALGFAFGAGTAARDTGFYDLDRRMFLKGSERGVFVDDVRSGRGF